MSSPAPFRSVFSVLSWPFAHRLSSISELLVWPIAISSCAWIAAFILFRSVQPYPLDAFEEYELHKAMRWAEGASLYGMPADEPFPEVYPPLYFLVLGVWQWLVGPSFLLQRAVSLIALAGALACGLWAVGDTPNRSIGRLIFLTGFLNLHTFCGRYFEVGKPDMLFVMFLAAAIVTGQHRSKTEILISSLSLWLASLTKQNAPLFIAPLALWHFYTGRPRWAVSWSLAMSVVIGVSYGVINWVTVGQFWHWVFVWTAAHGVDFGTGSWRAMQALFVQAPSVLVVLTSAIVFRRQCLWTWCLVAALGVAVLGMSKAGGRESHLLPVAYTAALVAARWFGELWVRRTGFVSPSEFEWRDAVLRWTLMGVVLLTIVPGLPTRRDFRWIGKRARETSEWVGAVKRLDGRVAVSHHWLLARRAGAECFFSDLILEFRGLQVPEDVQHRIGKQEFDYLILCDDPATSATAEWSELIERYYTLFGQLDYANVSGVLPNRVYRRKSGM